ncbi:MAG: hypothetical protein V4724_32760 [Pseudomonadota bacterium]
MKRTIVGALLAAACCYGAQAQVTPPEVAAHQRYELSHGEPARWQRDDRTVQAQLHTLRKEIGAALSEARAACRQMPYGERKECMKEAQMTYTMDLANIRQLNADAHNTTRTDYDTSGR